MFVGTDIAQTALAIAVQPGQEARTTATDPASIATLVDRLATLQP